MEGAEQGVRKEVNVIMTIDGLFVGRNKDFLGGDEDNADRFL